MEGILNRRNNAREYIYEGDKRITHFGEGLRLRYLMLEGVWRAPVRSK